jgi:hypothetical protein
MAIPTKKMMHAANKAILIGFSDCRGEGVIVVEVICSVEQQ